MEAAGHKRLTAAQEEEEEEKADGCGEDEQRAVEYVACYRRNWSYLWADYYGDFEKRTELGPMRFTKEPVPSYANVHDALQVYSIKVMELKDTLHWPIDVFGFIAVRDSVDRNRNYIFERTRDNCQTLTEKDSSLALTGPSRAVLLVDPIEFEVELRVKGTRPSEDKILDLDAFEYNCITQIKAVGSLRKKTESGVRSVLEFKYAHLCLALEATIIIWISEGSTDICGKFIARTASVDENVTLLDSGDDMVAINSSDGAINLSRNVVVVEGHNGMLIVGVEARQSGDKKKSVEYKEFTPARSGQSHDTFDVGFCKMRVEVVWSLVF